MPCIPLEITLACSVCRSREGCNVGRLRAALSIINGAKTLSDIDVEDLRLEHVGSNRYSVAINELCVVMFTWKEPDALDIEVECQKR